MNEEKFAKKANEYDKARPTYPNEAIEFIAQNISNNAVLADIGCGTGKLAEAFLKADYTIYGIEPNKEMLEMAAKNFSYTDKFVPIKAAAEKTTLPDNFVDAVMVGQALHWFEIQEFNTECNRILKPSGKVFVIYNRFIGALANEYESFMFKNCAKFKGLGGGDSLEKIEQFFSGKYNIKVFDSQITILKHLFSAHYPHRTRQAKVTKATTVL